MSMQSRANYVPNNDPSELTISKEDILLETMQAMMTNMTIQMNT